LPLAQRRFDGATIVFDLDGTLVDTAPDLVGVLNVLLAEEGVAPLPLALARPMIGRGARMLIERGFAAAGVALDESTLSGLFARFIAAYRGRIAEASRPFDGVVAALDNLLGEGARLAVCTNKPTDLSVALLTDLGLASRFAAIVGPDAAPAPKPDPRHLLTAIALAQGDAARSVMVGDSDADARAARAAYVPLVLVSFGYADAPAGTLSPDVLIDHFDALPAACARLLAGCPPRTQPL
jgi:phosphoglycolate phosphatase